MLLRDIIGQEKLKQQLVEMVQHQRLSHALLFVGPEGSGALPWCSDFIRQHKTVIRCPLLVTVILEQR